MHTDFLKMLWNWSLVIWQIVGKEVKYINRLVLGLHLSKECLRNLSWDQYCLIFILKVYSIFLSCDICNFSDDTAPYVCDTNLAFVLAKLEKNSSIAMKWFDNNYMKMNSDKCQISWFYNSIAIVWNVDIPSLLPWELFFIF